MSDSGDVIQITPGIRKIWALNLNFGKNINIQYVRNGNWMRIFDWRCRFDGQESAILNELGRQVHLRRPIQ